MNQSLDPTALVYESIYGYCRVSSMEQANHGTSLAEQKKIITKMSMYLFDREPDAFTSMMVSVAPSTLMIDLKVKH